MPYSLAPQVGLDGVQYVDRASLGEGKMHWYSLGVYVGKEKKFQEDLEARLKEQPPMVDPTTGQYDNPDPDTTV
jgi:hypothetical protein